MTNETKVASVDEYIDIVKELNPTTMTEDEVKGTVEAARAYVVEHFGEDFEQKEEFIKFQDEVMTKATEMTTPVEVTEEEATNESETEVQEAPTNSEATN